MSPEQQFFDDPALDRLAGMVLALAGELHVVQDKLGRIETLLDAKGVVSRADIENFVADEAAVAASRRAFVAHVFEPLLGRLASKS